MAMVGFGWAGIASAGDVHALPAGGVAPEPGTLALLAAGLVLLLVIRRRRRFHEKDSP